MGRPKRKCAAVGSAVTHPSKAQVCTLLDLPVDVLGIICAACDMPTKMNMTAVCKRLHGMLANPGNDSGLWGDVTILVGGTRRKQRPTKKDLNNIFPWLLKRQSGIRAVVLRLVPGSNADPTSETLHAALFAIATAIKDTDMTLELRARPDLLPGDPWPFLEDMWDAAHGDSSLLALAGTLTVLEMHYEIACPTDTSMSYLTWLDRLEEMTLWLSVDNPWGGECDGEWEARNSFPELKRLSIGGDTWCADGFIREAGSQLTSLTLGLEEYWSSTPDLLPSLRSLHELKLHNFNTSRLQHRGGRTGGDCSHMTHLTALHLDCTGVDKVENRGGWEFLTTIPQLRLLTLEQLDSVSGSLEQAVLAMPQLEYLRFIKLRDPESRHIAQLTAKAAAQRPGLRIMFDDDDEDEPEVAAAAIKG